jgi:hypothetical protein
VWDGESGCRRFACEDDDFATESGETAFEGALEEDAQEEGKLMEA